MLFMATYILDLGLECEGDSSYFIELDLQFLLAPMGLIDIVKRCIGGNKLLERF